MLPGSDLALGLASGDGLLTELALLVRESGFTPLQALEAATVRATRFLGMSDSLGLVAPGMLADLVLLRADPRERIDNLRRIEMVFRDGTPVTGGAAR